jgi:hypothetical protein
MCPASAPGRVDAVHETVERPTDTRRQPTPPTVRTTRLPELVIAWAIGYGALRASFAAGHHPRFRPLPTDLVVFTGWGAVALVTAAGVVAFGLRSRVGWSRGWWLAACGVSAALVGASALTLIDVVGTLLWGLGLPHSAVSAASRAGCLAGAALLGAAARQHRRRWRAGCPHCGRSGPVAHWHAVRAAAAPRWARLAATTVMVAMASRFVAQLFLDADDLPFTSTTATSLFDGGFVLAGTLLPLALVHRWGRSVPRWLVAAPALAISVGLTAYFGIATGQLLLDLVGLVPDVDDGYPAAFLWVAVPAYLVWGLAMGAAALSYLRRTAPACRWCGR